MYAAGDVRSQQHARQGHLCHEKFFLLQGNSLPHPGRALQLERVGDLPFKTFCRSSGTARVRENMCVTKGQAGKKLSEFLHIFFGLSRKDLDNVRRQSMSCQTVTVPYQVIVASQLRER